MVEWKGWKLYIGRDLMIDEKRDGESHRWHNAGRLKLTICLCGIKLLTVALSVLAVDHAVLGIDRWKMGAPKYLLPSSWGNEGCSNDRSRENFLIV